MGKIRRAGYIFVSWKSDHPPRHVHVYREGRLPMKGSPAPAIRALIRALEAEGRL